MFRTHDIHSLTDFQRNTREHIERLKETGRPSVLTVNGRAEVVVQSAEAYQELLDLVERADGIIAVQRAIEAMRQGDEGIDADDVHRELRRMLGERRTA